MTNKELLNFKFVDRTNETISANDFIKNDKDRKVLIIKGKKSVGKNFFIDKIKLENSSLTFISLDFNDANHSSSYKLFIEELQKISNGKFIQFVKDNYTNVMQITAKTVSSVLEISGNTIPSEIINYMINTSMYFLSKKKEQESTVKLIVKYIEQLSKFENLVITIKDISKSDDYSLPIISQVILTAVETLKVKFIISVDEDDWNENKNDINTFFSYKVKCIPINLKRFTDWHLFQSILLDIFDLTSEDENSIQHVFNICNGYPGELKRFLSQLYFNSIEDFSLSQGKARWNKRSIQKIISNETKKKEFDNPIAKLIYMIVLFIDIEMTYDILLDISSYVADKIHILVTAEHLMESNIQKLIYTYQLLEIKFDEHELIALNANSDRDLLKIEFLDDKLMPLLSRYISEYLLTHREDFIKIGGKTKYLSQLSWHTYKSHFKSWETINFQIAKELYKQSELSLAKEIFIRLIDQSNNFSVNDRFIMASCFYDIGKYSLAEEIIGDIDTNNCGFDQLMLIVRIKNINMKKPYAIDLLSDMEKTKKFDSHLYEILDTKQRILSNIYTKRKDGKIIFDYLQSQYDTNKTTYNDFLLSSMEYYRGKKVQDNFGILEKVYIKNKNRLMLAELFVNKGFDLFWQGNIESAKTSFKNSIAIFESLRIQELSYALNNLANCLMMEGDFLGAISSLCRAQMFNKSKYTEIVLKTHLMVCYAIIDDDDFQSLYQYLSNYLKENKNEQLDVSIYLKVTYALGFVQEVQGLSDYKFDEYDYVHQAIALADSYDTETLPYIWFKDWKEEIDEDIKRRLNADQYPEFFNLRFEPWLLTITHD